ncbi:MAG TPA: hypothetical protein VG457_04235, partial [Planctomycetota bacterium]|nr:hypothetical protein [Planctomycetota bacterium]
SPLCPLVPKPVPFHGYYMRALESGPSMYNDDPTPLSFKGQKWSQDNFAILIYPAEPGRGKNAWITSMGAVFLRSDDWKPVFRFPTNEELFKEPWMKVD